MKNLNYKFVKAIKEKFNVEEIDIFQKNFLSFELKKKKIFIFLCKDYTFDLEVQFILSEISELEKSSIIGNSYICVIPKKQPTKDMCTYFNGKSFVHFIFFDTFNNSLVYDKKIYYSGSKSVKKLMELYKYCFDNNTVDGSMS